ncbi:MAG: adenylyltransferase/cytidyltransferase family protein [Candidatus Doudnabacteria bacterium]|nr:adenylyltransferase/cytidyltransferase family protein [Candidatus Doudnabacteria bacterium]
MSDKNNKKEIVVAVSGGFDPIHPGHIRLFHEAKSLGDKLVVILNNDHWLLKKKGFVFMNEKERKEVLEGLRDVDQVLLTKHPKNPEDTSVSQALKEIKPDIFANGGDRKIHNVPEVDVCKNLGCKMAWNVGHGGKIQSSSELVDKAIKTAPRKIKVRVKHR